MNIIKIKNLQKKYKKSVVLDNINFSIEEGRIYGFIGENGAGKTTLMRILTGLSKETSGEFSLFGQNGNKKRRNGIGCLIEGPALMLDLTAQENLKYKMIMNNIKDDSLINDLLEKVRLINVEKKKVRNFSLGMRQRLGIAMALVSNPKLLILDEPINGLDPTGIVEIRNLLIELNKKYEISIFISSHILSEMYCLATDYIFIHKGRIIQKLTQEELDKECSSWITVITDNSRKAVAALESIIEKDNITVMNNETIKIYNYEDSAYIAKYLITNDIQLKEIYIRHENLEDFYSEIIGQNINVEEQ